MSGSSQPPRSEDEADIRADNPKSDLVLRLVMGMLEEGTGLCALGNHDWTLLRHLKGRKVGVGEGLSSTLEQLAPLGKAFRFAVRAMLSRLPHQIRLPMPKGHPREGDGVMTVVHAAAPRHHLDKASTPSFARAIYGYGEVQEDGSLARRDWATDYKGARWIAHGHEPYAQPRELNRVIALDTGCVFGNALTMYRADQVEFLQERAHANHAKIAKTLL